MDLRLEAEENLRKHLEQLDKLVAERTEKLAESEERYRTLFNKAPSGIALVCEGQIATANNELARMFGINFPERLEGMSALKVIHPEDRAVAEEFITKLLETNVADEESIPPSLEGRFISRDGTNIYTIVTSVKITYEGKPAALLIIRDVSKMKLLTEQLAKAQRI